MAERMIKVKTTTRKVDFVVLRNVEGEITKEENKVYFINDKRPQKKIIDELKKTYGEDSAIFIIADNTDVGTYEMPLTEFLEYAVVTDVNPL